MIRLQLLLSYFIVRRRRVYMYVYVYYNIMLYYALYWMKRHLKKKHFFFFYQVPTSCTYLYVSFALRRVFVSWIQPTFLRVQRRRGNNSTFLKIIFSDRPMGDNKRFFILIRAMRVVIRCNSVVYSQINFLFIFNMTYMLLFTARYEIIDYNSQCYYHTAAVIGRIVLLWECVCSK